MAQKVVASEPTYKSVFEHLLEAMKNAESTEGGGVIYCPTRLKFRLDMLTKKEEDRFRKALREADNISVVSIPIGKKKGRYKDLFRNDQSIDSISRKGGKEMIYVPPRTFQRVWCRNGKAPDYVTIIK